MLFSIIVPVYNVEKYLNQCVDSILNQSCKDFELILVDDGSTDGSSAICDDYAKKDNRVKVIHKENGGQTSARNAGVDIAVSQYLVFIDSDDWVDLDYLQNFEIAIKQHNVDVVCCGMVETTVDSKKNIPFDYDAGFYEKQDIKNKIFPSLIYGFEGKNFSPTLWAKAIKKELYQSFSKQVDHRIKIGEDSAIIKPCIYNANSIYVSEQCSYFYRTNFNSVTKNKKAFFWQGPKLRGQLLEEQFNTSDFDFQSQIYRMVTHSLFNVVCSQFNRKEKYSVIVKDVKENLKDPYYVNAIKNCKTKSKKLRFACFALKNKAFWLIKIYNKIK